MQPLKLQPAFRLEVSGHRDKILEQLRRAIRSPELSGLAESAGPCLDFKIERADRRFWSPHLSVQLSEMTVEDGETATEIFGRFSPRPEIWTGVMLTYLSALCLMLFAAVFGYAQWALGSRPWVLVAVPVGFILIGAIHAASLIGQSLSADQMHLLRARFDRAIEIGLCDIKHPPSDTPGEGVTGALGTD